MNRKDLNWCKGCRHLSNASGDPICGYSYNTGKLRSLICKAGYGCTCHTKFKNEPERSAERRTIFISPESFRTNRREYTKIDKAVARKMYDEGKKDREIAEFFHCTPSSVAQWRKAYGLPSKYRPVNRKADKNGKGSSGTAV